MLGLGDRQHELIVRVVDVCVMRERNGEMIGPGELSCLEQCDNTLIEAIEGTSAC